MNTEEERIARGLLITELQAKLAAHVPCQACAWDKPRPPTKDEEPPIVRGALDAQGEAEARAMSSYADYLNEANRSAGLTAEVERLQAALTAAEERAVLDVDILEWAAEMPCEMEADDADDYDPKVCSKQHTGRCWPCEARVRLAEPKPAPSPEAAPEPAHEWPDDIEGEEEALYQDELRRIGGGSAEPPAGPPQPERASWVCEVGMRDGRHHLCIPKEHEDLAVGPTGRYGDRKLLVTITPAEAPAAPPKGAGPGAAKAIADHWRERAITAEMRLRALGDPSCADASLPGPTESDANKALRSAARSYAKAWDDYANEPRKARAVGELEAAARAFAAAPPQGELDAFEAWLLEQPEWDAAGPGTVTRRLARLAWTEAARRAAPAAPHGGDAGLRAAVAAAVDAYDDDDGNPGQAGLVLAMALRKLTDDSIRAPSEARARAAEDRAKTWETRANKTLRCWAAALGLPVSDEHPLHKLVVCTAEQRNGRAAAEARAREAGRQRDDVCRAYAEATNGSLWERRIRVGGLAGWDVAKRLYPKADPNCSDSLFEANCRRQAEDNGHPYPASPSPKAPEPVDVPTDEQHRNAAEWSGEPSA